MTLSTHVYKRETGWDRAPDASLDSKQTVVFVFAAPSYIDDNGAIEQIRSAFPQSATIGCSSAGEICDTQLLDESVCIVVARFRHTPVRFASARCASSEHSWVAGSELGNQLRADDLAAVFVVSDGLCVNGSELVKGLRDTLPSTTIITGGLAGDGARFERTWVLDGGVPTEQCVTAVGLYGTRVRVGHGSRGGWDAFGPVRRVTRSAGNVLYELDGKPALELYKTYLGELAENLPSSGLLYPLSIKAPDRPDALVRTLLAVSEADQSLTFAGDIPNGSDAQLMRANFDRIIDAAGVSASLTRQGQGAQPTGVLTLLVSCVGRRLILGERAEEELEAAHEGANNADAQIGFYSYGELSPVQSGSCELHNQTMTITTLFEL